MGRGADCSRHRVGVTTILSAADQCGSAYDREEEGRHTVAVSIAGGSERPIGNQDWLGHVVRDSNYNMRLKLSDISKYNIAFRIDHDRPIEATPTGAPFAVRR